MGGEAGAGKTTLVRAFCARPDRDIRVLAGACRCTVDPASTRPAPLDVATSVMPSPTRSRRQLSPRRCSRPAVRARRAADVLVLEDLHWGDEATFDVLRLLAPNGWTYPLSSSEPIATTACRGITRCGCWRATSPRRAAVGRLCGRSLSAQRRPSAELAVGHEVDLPTSTGATGGNPFFVAQVLAPPRGGVPPTVRDAVLARASGLGPGALEVLETVVLDRAAGGAWPSTQSRRDATATSTSASRAGLVTSADDAGAAVPPRARAAAVEESLSPSRRLGLHRAVLLGPRRDDPPHDPHASRTTPSAPATPNRCSRSRLPPQRGRPAGAYREAAAQYARALRVSADLTTASARSSSKAVRRPLPRRRPGRGDRGARRAIEHHRRAEGATAREAPPRPTRVLPHLPGAPGRGRRCRRRARSMRASRACPRACSSPTRRPR